MLNEVDAVMEPHSQGNSIYKSLMRRRVFGLKGALWAINIMLFPTEL